MLLEGTTAKNSCAPEIINGPSKSAVKVVVWAGWSTTGRPWILAEKKKGRA
jgi:hypothetical protein